MGKADIAVTNSGVATEGGGGRQAGIGPAAAAKCGPAAGLLVFLIGAALLALVGLVAEAGVVETQTPWLAQGWASGGGPICHPTCRRRASCDGMERGICGRSEE